jgi:hypothetical protein
MALRPAGQALAGPQGRGLDIPARVVPDVQPLPTVRLDAPLSESQPELPGELHRRLQGVPAEDVAAMIKCHRRTGEPAAIPASDNNCRSWGARGSRGTDTTGSPGRAGRRSTETRVANPDGQRAPRLRAVIDRYRQRRPFCYTPR